MTRPRCLIAAALLGGALLQGLLWSRQWIYGDQYSLFLSGLDLLETGRLPAYAKYMSGGGHIPGALLPLLIAAPLEAWFDYRAPALLIGACHLASVAVLAACLGRALGGSFLAAYLGVYWLSPWRLYHAGFVWEPAYVFLPAAVHLASAWHLRDRPYAGWSLLLAATLTLTLQVHASFVVLVVLTALLAARRLIHVDWRGALAGVLAGGLTLVPTALAWRAGTLPDIAPGETEDFSRVLAGALNVLKGLAYWLRLGVPDIGRRLRETSFAEVGVAEAGGWGAAASGVTAVLVATSVASVLVAVAASWQYFRPRSAAGAADAVDLPGRASAYAWFRAYAGWCLVAMCASAAASPVPVQGWHVVIAFHAACLPVAFWLRAAFQGASFPLRAIAVAFLVLEVAVVLALAFGHPMYRPLSGDRLANQDLPEAIRALIPGP